MKIDEPDTPYARYDPADDPDVVQGASPLSPPKELQPVRSTSLDDHLGDLSEKLARAATDSEKPRAALFVEEEERDEAKARAFAAKRQQHYNMAGLLGRKWDEEDEMEDDDQSLCFYRPTFPNAAFVFGFATKFWPFTNTLLMPSWSFRRSDT